jgi:hypothetical protein
MKHAVIKRLGLNTGSYGLSDVAEWIENNCVRYGIDVLNWNKFLYMPDVKVSMAYDDGELFLRFYVSERYFKAEKTVNNDKVFEDSCVEFFVAPENDEIYYNLEVNAIGTCLLGSGYERFNRTLAEKDIIAGIRTLSSVGKLPLWEAEGDVKWDILIAIPEKTFFHHKVKYSKGTILRGNFYKCGDKLKQSHYLSWNPVGTDKPDFHQPSFFGEIVFD